MGDSKLSTQAVPPGWYPDPNGKPCERYWDGEFWQEETRPNSTLEGKPAPKPTKSTLDNNEKLLLGILGIAILLTVLFSPF